MSSEKTPLAEATPVASPPPSKWKSDLFGCLKYGCCHPALLCSWFTPQLHMGQVLTRMKMTWLGEESGDYKSTFGSVCTIWIVTALVNFFFYCELETIEENDEGGFDTIRNEECSESSYKLSHWVAFLSSLYTFVVLIKLRVAIRNKYNIDEEYCPVCEDCICIGCCGCLSLVQMSHQTADYDDVSAAFFTPTGLSSGDEDLTEAVVV
mmetsp:Transcript_16696/g.45819  ORF Transcript_16696/g.45819 Transcript_16696/m.45819 type:complete len:208 (+) Transcript_16696:138-761(+)|eukprot:CAMPEP_0172372136 /NCGR_PEP_ID=MMETSP1060-20121228/46116_1 /TAXON_ID=37318 /ORGANISM="Pseudo-nitzschia pungens, Strain cf. cingulata" /LENGTH=207 /DNA_ID=CAMNT_0013097987 /DNA_START=121 /DNA_END=744 /DNA_ORIENTATION=-